LTNHDAERVDIQAAAERLLAGTPLRSTGELTVVQLAVEAGMKRWLLTHKHRDLAQQFQARAKAAGGDPPPVKKLKARVGELDTAVERLRTENAQLQVLVQRYALIINELSLDHEKVKAERVSLQTELDSLQTNVRAISDHPSQTRSRS
jgi:chromosome segregation ATPase